MATWLLTIGNSDVQLNDDTNWESLYDEVYNEPPLKSCDRFRGLEQDQETGRYLTPARVLGLVYAQQRDHYEDLVFPLLDVFVEYFRSEGNPTRVVVLLTDQSSIFGEEDFEYQYCPF